MKFFNKTLSAFGWKEFVEIINMGDNANNEFILSLTSLLIPYDDMIPEIPAIVEQNFNTFRDNRSYIFENISPN